MLFLSAKDLVNLLPPGALVSALECGLRSYRQNRVIVPARQHLNFGEGTLLTMPAFDEETFGVKVVSVMPSNTTRGLPVIQGLMTLNDWATGTPLALFDAAALTAQRTGAIGGLGLKYTTPPDIDTVGIIGVGVQGTWQAIFACAVRKIRTLYFVARSDKKARLFRDAVSCYVPSVQVVRSADAQELLMSTKTVITATNAKYPVLPDDRKLLEGGHFMSIGSFKPSMRELPDAAYALARQVVVDSEAAKFEVGDIIDPLSSGMLRDDDVLHIAACVTGQQTVDTRRTTVFKSVGMALYDLYAARAFLAEARRLGRGTALDA